MKEVALRVEYVQEVAKAAEVKITSHCGGALVCGNGLRQGFAALPLTRIENDGVFNVFERVQNLLPIRSAPAAPERRALRWWRRTVRPRKIGQLIDGPIDQSLLLVLRKSLAARLSSPFELDKQVRI